MLVLASLPVAALSDSLPDKLPTLGTSIQGATQFNGDLVVYVLKDNIWQVQGSIPFDRFLSKKELKLTDLPNTDEVKIKIVQKQGGSAHLDSVFLGAEKPIEVTGEDMYLKKLSKQDLDVITVEKSGIDITFPQGQKDRTLEICARIEAVVISQTPFLFPVQSGKWVINEDSSFYSYKLSSSNETPKLNEIFNTLSAEEPFFKEVCLPGSGHPPGNMYGWVKNDSENLYIAIDATSDNTMDADKDYVKVYAKTADGIKMFKLSVPETKWGKASFIYTDKVAYQHKVYEFTIPLSELSISDIGKAQDLPLAFEVYGTLSDPIYFEPDSYQVNEDSDEVLVRIIRPDGQQPGIGTAVITCQINDATSATLDVDFTIQRDGQIVFDEGVRERTVLIKLIDDNIEENVEKIALSIFFYSGEGTHIGSSYEAVITVNDNDGSAQVEKTVQFERANYETIERDGASVYVTRSGAVDKAVDVMYKITDISTTKGQDYIDDVETGTFEIAAGERRYHLWIPLLNDGEEEPNETFKIRLVEADSGVSFGVLRETTVTILHDDEDDDNYQGTISFEKRNYSVKEDAGVAEIKVIYNPEEYEGPYYMTLISDGELPEDDVAVKYTTEDGTAIEGSDYARASGILIFADTYEQTFTIPIENDLIDEEDETVKLLLVDGSRAGPGEIINATLTIIDDDDDAAEPEKGTINFAEPTYSIRENNGKAIITVVYTPQENEEQFSLASGDVVTVDFASSDGTAKEGVDYERTAGTLTFNAEELIKTFEVPIKNDSKAESNETVNLTLTDTTGRVKLGEQDNAVLTIVNDDKQKAKNPSKPKEVPPSVENLPKGTIIGRMNGYITLSQPIKIIDGSKELQLSYNTEMSQNNMNNTPRVYYWNAEKKNWVALATYDAGDGKVKAINDNGYKGWFVVFGVIEPGFSDLEGSVFEVLLNRMNGLGIIEGIPIKGETKVRRARPEQNITRAEFTMLISRILNIDVDDHKLPLLSEVEAMLFIYANYNDLNKIAEWVANPVGTLTRAELIAGEGNEFRGTAPITRIEAAVMISKALRLLKECKPADFSNVVDAYKIPEWAKEQVVEGVITIYPDNTIRPSEDITRADAFEMLYKLFVIGLGW
jgi:hypothetical protein